VRLAQAEEVDFVILAGDIFDRDWHDMRTVMF
jgi:DNA repair exonuclease SbcCD nuclease subunit